MVADGGNNDNDTFNIDRATGQLKVKVGETLNFEDPTDVALAGADPAVDATDNTYVVTLKATDSSGDDSDPVTVVITVTDVNEKPTFGAGIAGMAPDTGRTAWRLTILRSTSSSPCIRRRTRRDAAVTLELMGNDADKFELANDTDETSGVSRVLSFKEKPGL